MECEVRGGVRMNCPKCNGTNITYHGTLEGRGDEVPTLTMRSLSCDDCDESWIYLPKEPEE